MPGRKSAARRRYSGSSWSRVSRRSNSGRQHDPSNSCPRLIRRRKRPKGAASCPGVCAVSSRGVPHSGVSSSSIERGAKTMPRLSRLLTTLPCDAQALRECVLEQHLSPRAIAAQLGISVARVRSALRALDLPSPASPPRGDPSGHTLDRYYTSYQKSAAQRSHVFALSKERFAALVSESGSYCGRAPMRKVGACFFRGIDRIDSTLGYIEGNVRPCCGTYNRAKWRMSEQVCIAWILRAADHLRAKSEAEMPQREGPVPLRKRGDQ